MSEPPGHPPEEPEPQVPEHRLDPDRAAAGAGGSIAPAPTEPRPYRPPPPAIDTRPYRWMIGIFGLVLVILISVYQFVRHGVGSPGVQPGKQLHLFVAPLATSGLNLDANVHPRCDLRRPAPAGLNICGRTPVVLGFFVTGSDACKREVDTIQAVSRQFSATSIQFAAVAVRSSRAAAASVARSHHWTIPVAYDRDGAVGELYGVQICPMVEVAEQGAVVGARLIGEHWLNSGALAARVRAVLVK